MGQPTLGLRDYLDYDAERASWDRFRDYEAGQAYRQLIEVLADLQHGLCGYCEIDLTELDRQVEHVVPRSDQERGEQLALNVGNLIACCKGGTERIFAPDARAELDRYLKPMKHNRSCGEAKDDARSGEFVDPRTLPALPSLTKVVDDGRIEPDAPACASVGMDATGLATTIDILNLNAERLCVARARRWSALNDEWSDHLGDPEVMSAAARGELLPHDNGLPRFFTTSRSFFGPVAERVLNEQPQTWI